MGAATAATTYDMMFMHRGGVAFVRLAAVFSLQWGKVFYFMSKSEHAAPLPVMPDPRIDPTRLPQHIAIIMDGNGRWAAKHGLPTVAGHEAGAESVRRCMEACRDLGIPVLSLYAFSTENWGREKDEVDALFSLISRFIQQEIEEIDENDIRIRVMGRLEHLPEQARQDLCYSMERTRNNHSFSLNVAINYGSRAELVDAMRSLARQVQAGALQPDEIDESKIREALYLPEFSEVDLLIRTSGEQRLSNFMLWQVSYAEFLFSKVLWPDFGKQDLFDAVVDFQQRHRRFGGDHDLPGAEEQG